MFCVKLVLIQNIKHAKGVWGKDIFPIELCKLKKTASIGCPFGYIIVLIISDFSFL